MNSADDYAPVALFAYKRPVHLQNTLDSLYLNQEGKETVLYIFCDGPKAGANQDDLQKIEEVRLIAKSENRFKEVFVECQEMNLGLADSIIYGVSKVVNKYRKVIVLEDDLVLSPFFLKFMNDALSLYEFNERVGQIGACNFFACGNKYPDTFFIPIPDCLGWGTWKSRWDKFNPNAEELNNALMENAEKLWIFNAFGAYDYIGMLESQIKGKVDSWAIRWQAVCVLNNWFTLYPNPSLTNHIYSEEPTHTSVRILPPLAYKEIPVRFKQVELEKNVIRAFKLGLSNLGDYYGNYLYRKAFKRRLRRIKKSIKLIIKHFIKKVIDLLLGSNKKYSKSNND